MDKNVKFKESIKKSYPSSASVIHLGSAVLEGEIIAEAQVSLPLRMMNRHGMVAGATGSGKTRTLQLLAEQLSKSGVPVFLSDIKGDLGGMAEAGEWNDRIKERAHLLHADVKMEEVPVEFYSLSGKKGSPMRATVTEFGPILLSKILELNDTQTGVLAMIFKYADDQGLPLIDFDDLKKIVNFLTDGPGASEIKEQYGSISKATSGTIIRKIVALEQQGVSGIFGEPSFEISDLFQKSDGRGVVSILNVSDVQDKPALFSTFMLSLLVEIYQTLPEAGDLEKPKLVFFLDEAHLLFKDASKAFLDQVEQIIRLIRSKGVGVFFCSQMAQDIPPSILSQLGNRFQHVLRAFTPNDVQALKTTAKSFPKSDYYAIEDVITQMGIGQALVTVLNEKGIPTEVAVTHLLPPSSAMRPVTPAVFESLLNDSNLHLKYAKAVNRESAFEMLEKRLKANLPEESSKSQTTAAGRQVKNQPSEFEKVLKSSFVRTLGREIVRGLFGMIAGSSTSSRKRR